MGYLGFLLFPLYTWLFYYIFKLRRKKYDPLLQQYHLWGFWIKVAAALLFTFYNFFLSQGDSYLLFYREGWNLAGRILSDFDNINWLFDSSQTFDNEVILDSLNNGYFKTPSNYMVAKFAIVFNILGGFQYSTVNLIFSMMAFTGAWRLFRFFYEEFPQLHKEAFISVFCLFSFSFWSAGALKDSICIAGLGLITYSLYEMLLKKKSFLTNIAIIIINVHFVLVVKSYIIASYLPFFAMFLVLKNIGLIKNAIAKVLLLVFVGMFVALFFSLLLGQLTETMASYVGDDITSGVIKYQKSYEGVANARSAFNLGVTFTGNFSSLLLVTPFAIVATLFRPFLWEVNSPASLVSSLESMFFIYCSYKAIFRSGLRSFFRTLKANPLVIFCLIFSLLFALFVGATTGNFGSLVRYKIPCMPFYLFAIQILAYKQSSSAK